MTFKPLCFILFKGCFNDTLIFGGISVVTLIKILVAIIKLCILDLKICTNPALAEFLEGIYNEYFKPKDDAEGDA